MGVRWYTLTGKQIKPTRAKPEPRKQKVVGKTIPWRPVKSSWIEAIRFVHTDLDNRQVRTGYIDMRTKGGSVIYRYGPGIKVTSFTTWLVAASRGKYFWRYFTKKWSPATKL